MEDTRFYNSMINFASQLGKVIGGLYASKVIVHGRRRAFLMFSVLSVLACLMMQYLNIWAFILSKFLFGIFCTVVHLATMKHLSETTPVNMIGRIGIFVQISSSLGILTSLSFGIFMPKGDYDPSI